MVSKKLLIGSVIGAIIIGGLIFGMSILMTPKPTAPELWSENPTLDSPIEPTWFWENGTEGDNSDVFATTSSGQADLVVFGEEHITEVSDPLNDGTWYKYRNENFLFPDTANITSEGCYVSHDYDENVNQTHQYHSSHWRKEVDVGYDMTDYIITSASLDVIFNASVNQNLEVLGEGSRYTVGDFARFYVLIADSGYTNTFRVAYNRTISLGLNGAPTTINDTDLETVSQQDLIIALESALDKDPSHSNFSISIGIDVYCEDNEGADRDIFNALIIKSLNLSFNYEKNINQFTKLSWNHISENVIGDNYYIVGGNFNFKYKIDKVWPGTAPLSELRFYINEKLYSEEIIKLNTINTSFTLAKSGGFDVLSYLEKNINISISIEINIKDDFQLEEQITISIDDIYLYIELREISEDFSFLIYILVGAIAGLTIVFTLYEKHFKYPPMVRKIRKLRKQVKKNKKQLKALNIHKRNDLLNSNYQNKLKVLETELIQPPSPQKVEIIKKETESKEEPLI